MRVRVISFHHISSAVPDIKRYPGISTPYSKFILLILALKLCGYKFCSFDEVPRFSRRRIIVLNFDDAYYSVYKKAFPVLSFFGIKAHVCITGESLFRQNRKDKLALMGTDEVNILRSLGWDFINHTMNHTALVNKDGKELNEEINDNSRQFANIGIMLNTDYFCLPEGKSDEIAEKFIFAAGYKHILTSREGIWDTEASPVIVPRINISSQPFWYAFYKINFKFSAGKYRLAAHNKVIEI